MSSSSAAPVEERARELAEAFALFEAWEDRYRFLIDLGRELDPLPDGARTEENRVHGCQSNVWMLAFPDSGGALDFRADSDSAIVRGLIALLHRLYGRQRADAVLAFDIEAFFADLELDQHLSMGRRNGLSGMVSRLRGAAAALANGAAPASPSI